MMRTFSTLTKLPGTPPGRTPRLVVSVRHGGPAAVVGPPGRGVMQQARRQVVFVSGAPGAGKTTLAVPLAAELGFALVSKDRIKETLHDALGAPPPDLAWSRRLGAAAMELLWALAADAPAVVVEANFRPRDP